MELSFKSIMVILLISNSLPPGEPFEDSMLVFLKFILLNISAINEALTPVAPIEEFLVLTESEDVLYTDEFTLFNFIIIVSSH